MKVTVIGKNINVTPALKEMVEKKISKLDRYFSPDVEARATLTVQRNNQIFEVTIPFNGVILRCEESSEDMYKSIDLVEAKLERQINDEENTVSREVIRVYLEDEFFNDLKKYLEDEDYAMAKDATKGLYLLAMELKLYRLYETLLDIYEDLESELYTDVLKHYEDMYSEYRRLKEEYQNV